MSHNPEHGALNGARVDGLVVVQFDGDLYQGTPSRPAVIIQQKKRLRPAAVLGGSQRLKPFCFGVVDGIAEAMP